MIVAAVDQRCGRPVLELHQHCSAGLRRPLPIEDRRMGAHRAHLAAREQARRVDLVRHLVEQDAAALRRIKLLRPPRTIKIIRVVERVDHAMDPDQLAAVGRDVECMALARAVRWHAEHRISLNGKSTVVLQ